MKKILLAIGLVSLGLVGRSQTVLNEIYTLPGNNKHEFFELYNSSIVGAQSVDCFTIVTYWVDGSNRGVYVMDLPNLQVGAKDFFVGAAANPFATQNLSGVVPDFSWNDANFRNGSTGGSLKKYQLNVNGTTWDDVSGTIPADFNDFLFGGNGNDYFVLVFASGQLSNGFIGGSSSGALPVAITGLPVLAVDMNGCADFNITFAGLGTVENVISQPGSDNGYARTSDGKCGAWVKTSAGVQHTPGTTNGSASGLTGSLETAQLIQCGVVPGINLATFNITAVSGDVTEAADFPVEVQLYYDFGIPGELDGADVYQSSKFENAVADPAQSFEIAQTQNVIFVYKTKRGCFDKVVAVANGCAPLPVSLKSFTAARSRSNVGLKWETTTEVNNAGFTVQRNIGGTWQDIAFVPSQAAGGNSDALLTYTLNDLNPTKGITQYRLRQVDLDGKFKLSDIRAVRGEGQIGKTIVYPNPSNTGNVNIVFEDANVKRDVSVIDMSGKIIKQWRNVSNNNLQLENLPSGVFSVRILSVETGEQVVEKIIVNKR
jgi:hypothetical protein